MRLLLELSRGGYHGSSLEGLVGIPTGYLFLYESLQGGKWIQEHLSGPAAEGGKGRAKWVIGHRSVCCGFLVIVKLQFPAFQAGSCNFTTSLQTTSIVFDEDLARHKYSMKLLRVGAKSLLLPEHQWCHMVSSLHTGSLHRILYNEGLQLHNCAIINDSDLFTWWHYVFTTW